MASRPQIKVRGRGPATSDWGDSQATLSPGSGRQNTNSSGQIFIRFINPHNALAIKISSIPVFEDPIPLSTKIVNLKKFTKTKILGMVSTAPFTVDLHIESHPLLADGDLTLYDYDLTGTRTAPLNLFICPRYIAEIRDTDHFGDEVRTTSNCNAWHPVDRTTKAAISTFCCSLEMLRRELTDSATQRRFLTALWQTTHYLPAVYAMANFFDRRSLALEEKAVLAQTFQALCMKVVPGWATGKKPERALEGSRQILGWLVDQVQTCKRGGSGKEDWTRRVIIKQAAPAASGLVTADNQFVTVDLQNGSVLKMTMEFLDKSTNGYPNSRQLVLAFRGNYAFDGNSYLVFPKDAGNFLSHRILHHPTPEGFYEQIINTTSLPGLRTVAPLALPTSHPPTLTLNSQGLISIFEFGGDCDKEWAKLWNPVTGIQKLMVNDQGQSLAKSLTHVIPSRKASDAWPLDGWDIGCLNTGSIEPRKAKEAVMICIDCSESMQTEAFANEDTELDYAQRKTKMSVARELFKQYAFTTSNYKQVAQFGVMKFNRLVSLVQDWTPLLGDVESNIEKHLNEEGCTAMWDCIGAAANKLIEFEKGSPGVSMRIIVLTDGEDNESKNTAKSIYAYLWNHKIVLDSIALGCDCKEADLFRISKVTGGRAFKPLSTAETYQIATSESMVDQSLRVAAPRHCYLPYFDSVIPMSPMPLDEFSATETRKHPNEDDEFMPIIDAQKTFGKNKQFEVSKGEIRAASDVVKSRRILLEIKEIIDNPHPDMDVYVSESNMAFWKVVIEGPAGSSYEKGTFAMFLDMTDDFPRKAPLARFITPIMHPNINKHGRVCHTIIDHDWKAETTLRMVLCCIYGLLMAPERNQPVEAATALKYMTDESLYTTEVLTHIKKFASANRKDWAYRIVPDFDAIPESQPSNSKRPRR